MEPIVELEDNEDINYEFDSTQSSSINPLITKLLSSSSTTTITSPTNNIQISQKQNSEITVGKESAHFNSNAIPNNINTNTTSTMDQLNNSDTNNKHPNSSLISNLPDIINLDDEDDDDRNNMGSQFRSRSYTWPQLSLQQDDLICETPILGVDEDEMVQMLTSNIEQLNHHTTLTSLDRDDNMMSMLINDPDKLLSNISNNNNNNNNCWSDSTGGVATVSNPSTTSLYGFNDDVNLPTMLDHMQPSVHHQHQQHHHHHGQQQQHLYPAVDNSSQHQRQQQDDNHMTSTMSAATLDYVNTTSTINNNANNCVTNTNNATSMPSISSTSSSHNNDQHQQQQYFDGTMSNNHKNSNNTNQNNNNHNSDDNEPYSSLNALDALDPTVVHHHHHHQHQQNGSQFIQRQRSGSNPHQHSEQSSTTQKSTTSTTSSSSANKKNSSRRNAWGNMSYADLITQAINGSMEKRLTLSQIYEWMVQNVNYFKDKGDSNSSAGWKNSIRHNLSLHNRFMRVQNEGTGKSSWWMLNPDAKPGKAARRRAISMETHNYEKRRGRVKKHVEQLRAMKAAAAAAAAVANGSNANSGGVAGANDNLSLTTLSEYAPLKSSSSEINLAGGLMSPTMANYKHPHSMSGHHQKNLLSSSNVSLSNLNLSDSIGGHNNNNHILVTSPSSTESFDLYSESSFMVGSHYMHHPYSSNEFRPRASSNASSTCSNLLLDSNDNHPVSSLWYGSNGSNLNATYPTTINDAYIQPSVDSSLQMIECLNLDADSPQNTYTMLIDEPQQPQQPALSSPNKDIHLLSNATPSSSSNASSTVVASKTNPNNNTNTGNNVENKTQRIRPGSYHDLFNRLQQNLSQQSTSSSANKQPQQKSLANSRKIETDFYRSSSASAASGQLMDSLVKSSSLVTLNRHNNNKNVNNGTVNDNNNNNNNNNNNDSSVSSKLTEIINNNSHSSNNNLNNEHNLYGATSSTNNSNPNRIENQHLDNNNNNDDAATVVYGVSPTSSYYPHHQQQQQQQSHQISYHQAQPQQISHLNNETTITYVIADDAGQTNNSVANTVGGTAAGTGSVGVNPGNGNLEMTEFLLQPNSNQLIQNGNNSNNNTNNNNNDGQSILGNTMVFGINAQQQQCCDEIEDPTNNQCVSLTNTNNNNDPWNQQNHHQHQSYVTMNDNANVTANSNGNCALQQQQHQSYIASPSSYLNHYEKNPTPPPSASSSSSQQQHHQHHNHYLLSALHQQSPMQSSHQNHHQPAATQLHQSLTSISGNPMLSSIDNSQQSSVTGVVPHSTAAAVTTSVAVSSGSWVH